MKTNIVLCCTAMLAATFFSSCKKDNSTAAVQVSTSQRSDLKASLARGLMAWYPFNGNTLDSSGNNNHVIFNNCTPAEDQNGNPNGAYYFDGRSSYMQVKNSGTLNPAKISVTIKFKISGFNHGICHGNRVIQKGSDDNVSGEFFLGFDDSYYTNGANCGTSFVNEAHENIYAIYGDTPGQNTIAGDFTNNLVKDKWYTMVFTYDGTYAKFYVDGTLTDTNMKKAIANKNTEDIFFGKMNNSQFPYWFNGVIDEIRMYNFALSAQQVALLSGK